MRWLHVTWLPGYGVKGIQEYLVQPRNEQWENIDKREHCTFVCSTMRYPLISSRYKGIIRNSVALKKYVLFHF